MSGCVAYLGSLAVIRPMHLPACYAYQLGAEFPGALPSDWNEFFSWAALISKLQGSQLQQAFLQRADYYASKAMTNLNGNSSSSNGCTNNTMMCAGEDGYTVL